MAERVSAWIELSLVASRSNSRGKAQKIQSAPSQAIASRFHKSHHQ
jgi:hypothetical protein